MIYTTYFANLKSLPESIVPISIALYPPRWYSGIRFDRFAPMKYILERYKDGRYDDAQYTKEYKKQLDSLDFWSTYDLINRMAGDKDYALICYETPDKFCHRNLVAEWYKQHGIEVNEYV